MKMMKSKKNMGKPLTAVLFAAIMIVSVLAVMPSPALAEQTEEDANGATTTPYLDPIDETGTSETFGNSWTATITIDSGTNFDIYAWWNQDITATYNWDPEHKPVTEIESVTMDVIAWDVDNAAGTPPPTTQETDLVYLNNQYLGVLVGPNQGAAGTPIGTGGWWTTTFVLINSQINVIFDSASYPLALTPYIDSDSQHNYMNWAATVDKIIITIEYEANEANRPPNLPTNLKQLLPDDTRISVGGAIDETTVSFRGTVTDVDGDMVKLQVELRRLDEFGGDFDETQGGLKESDFFASGTEVTCEANDLIPSDYHWRARTIDEYGSKSEWRDFGNNLLSDPDFIVVPVVDEKPRIICIEPESGGSGIEARIEGKNLNNVLGHHVYFDGQSANIISWSDTEILVNVPLPPTQELIVDVKAGDFFETNSVKFTYKEPTIDFIYPSFGKLGIEVNIEGRDFGLPPSLQNIVYFGCSKAAKLSWTDTEIVVEAPTDLGTGENDRKFLKNLIKLVVAGWTIGEEIPDWIPDITDWMLNKIIDKLLECELEITSTGRIYVPVRVDTPVGSSNTVTFEYRVSTIIESYLCSPGELRVYDSLGNIAGLVNGEAKEEIPLSLCDGNSVIIVSPTDSYKYDVMGTDEDTYGLVVNFVEDGEPTTFSAIDIPTLPNATHQYIINWITLSQGEEGVTIQIDADGDGIFEQTITADSELTHDEFMLQTATTIDIDPDTLNLNSSGKWITCYIELPEGYGVVNINISTILLNDVVHAEDHPTNISDYDDDGIPDLMVKFDRQEVIAILEPGENVAITVTGQITGGTQFEGIDYIRVI